MHKYLVRRFVWALLDRRCMSNFVIPRLTPIIACLHLLIPQCFATFRQARRLTSRTIYRSGPHVRHRIPAEEREPDLVQKVTRGKVERLKISRPNENQGTAIKIEPLLLNGQSIRRFVQSNSSLYIFQRQFYA